MSGIGQTIAYNASNRHLFFQANSRLRADWSFSTASLVCC